MAVHSPLAHLFPRSKHDAHTRGHTLGSPRLYDAFVTLFFLGRRRATFQTFVRAADVQQLMQKVRIQPSNDCTRAYPNEMRCRIKVFTDKVKKFEIEKKDYEGFFKRPMRWDRVIEKFERLAAPNTTPELRKEIIGAVANLDGIGIRDLTRLLGCVRQSVP